MTLVQEIQKVIDELPLDKATKLKSWLVDLKATRNYKHLEAYAKSLQVMDDFEKNRCDAILN